MRNSTNSLAEALAADVHAVLADQTALVGAHAAAAGQQLCLVTQLLGSLTKHQVKQLPTNPAGIGEAKVTMLGSKGCITQVDGPVGWFVSVGPDYSGENSRQLLFQRCTCPPRLCVHIWPGPRRASVWSLQTMLCLTVLCASPAARALAVLLGVGVPHVVVTHVE